MSENHERVRIQVLTHQVTEEVRQLEDELSETHDGRIADRTHPTDDGEKHEQPRETPAEERANEAKVAAAERQKDEVEHDPERVAQERDEERRRT